MDALLGFDSLCGICAIQTYKGVQIMDTTYIYNGKVVPVPTTAELIASLRMKPNTSNISDMTASEKRAAQHRHNATSNILPTVSNYWKTNTYKE